MGFLPSDDVCGPSHKSEYLRIVEYILMVRRVYSETAVRQYFTGTLFIFAGR